LAIPQTQDRRYKIELAQKPEWVFRGSESEAGTLYWPRRPRSVKLLWGWPLAVVARPARKGKATNVLRKVNRSL